MDIDIKELEAFACVVEKGSFSRAAEALYLTQPTISAHVASLERKLNIKLLVRTTKEIYPSDAGNLLYEYAKEILRLRTNAVQAIKAFSKEMRGTVSVAASTIPGQYYLPKLIQNFRAEYPDISFSLQILDSAEVAEQVSARKVEIGFTGPIRPDHGRMIWGEVAMPGYGLYDRALGATYLNGLWEAIEKSHRK